jgi:hypothetical protein
MDILHLFMCLMRLCHLTRQTLNVSDRLDYQAELLEKAQKFLAAQATLKDVLG